MVLRLHVIQSHAQVLRQGGMVLLRDYGIYDHAMLRFAPGHKISEYFYVRQDGTRAYYFSEGNVIILGTNQYGYCALVEKLSELFTMAGYDVVENIYIHKETTNIKEGICVPRVFIQGKFIKPFHHQA